jgi:hypothetical protein
MEMICYQYPCKTGSAGVYKNLAQPVNKVLIVDLVFKYGLELYPPDNDVVQCSGRIYSGFSRHEGRLTFVDPFVNFSPASPSVPYSLTEDGEFKLQVQHLMLARTLHG